MLRFFSSDQPQNMLRVLTREIKKRQDFKQIKVGD